MKAALRFAPGAPPIGAAKRLRGLRLAATDLDWTTGDGPIVEGPGEALLMAMAGCPAALPELSGPGTPTLAERITSRPAAAPDRRNNSAPRGCLRVLFPPPCASGPAEAS